MLQPEQTLQKAASDLNLRCLLLIQQFLDTSAVFRLASSWDYCRIPFGRGHYLFQENGYMFKRKQLYQNCFAPSKKESILKEKILPPLLETPFSEEAWCVGRLQEVTEVVSLQKAGKLLSLSNPLNPFILADQNRYLCKQCRSRWDGS